MSKKKEEKWEEVEGDVDEEQIKSYKSLIVQNWNKSRDAIIKVGQTLMEAKEKMNKGEFNQKSWLKLVNDELPFTPRTDDRLIAIAKCEWITSDKHKDSLPVSWGTLYEISRLTKEQFENGVMNKSITADSIRSDIETYKESLKNSPSKDSSKSTSEDDSITAPSKDSFESTSEDNSSVVEDFTKDKGDFTLGNIIINKSKIMNDKKFDVETIRKLQMEITQAVENVSKDLQLDFNALNSKIKKVEDKDWVDTVELGYKKLEDAVEKEIQYNPELADEYHLSPDGEMKKKNDFFKVRDLSFIANKVVENFGVDCLESALKDVPFPKPYFENLKKEAELATQVAA